MQAAWYVFKPDAGRAPGEPFPEGDGAGAYPYASPSRYAVAGDRGLVDAEVRAIRQDDAGEPAAFTYLRDLFWRLVGLTFTSINVAGLETEYEPGTVSVHTPDSGGMLAYGPSVREARPGTFADHSRPKFNVALNKRLLTNRAGLLKWHGTSGASEPVRQEANRHLGAQRPMGVWGRVTQWPKAVEAFRPFGRGDG